MDQVRPIYVIDESVRQAIITLISKAVHPSVPFDQVNSIMAHLSEMEPVQVMQGPPTTSAHQSQITESLQDQTVGPGEE